MSDEPPAPESDAGSSPGGGQYVVIARRYRPQSFQELVGQEQVAVALSNAISTQRVGHAYLFTGARGIGKTSTARILAKALNCVQGPTPTPCNECDICRSVASGEDVDVLEIDGASNRGIDEIRQLRSNVNIRPSRARYKVYIIDEVHMLTVPAFNALLKTLEEPPAHVKFIFCTTDADKVPVTVLSRCQRFDFPPVEPRRIAERLRFILDEENVPADDEALQLLARRSGGSMRDSQSLLEQQLSFCGEKITAEAVHRMLGTANSGRLSALVAKMVARDAAGVLGEVEQAVLAGVDVGQLAEQLLGYFRDMLAAAIGCEPELMLHSEAADYAIVRDTGKQMGIETLLAAIQVLDQSVARMRQSTHIRVLLEMALVRICRLEALDDLADLVAELRHLPQGMTRSSAVRPPASVTPGQPQTEPPPRGEPPPPQKKTSDGEESSSERSTPPSGNLPLDPIRVDQIWKQALTLLGDMTADHGARYERIAISAPNHLVVSFRAGYTLDKERCERPERKARIEEAIAQVTGQTVRVDFEILPDSSSAPAVRKPVASKRQRMRQKENEPLVRKAIELFEAEVTDLEEPPE
ncbi:MAG: DNA polymerase III subunit gamma/tau [Pirellulaceae bacterium]